MQKSLLVYIIRHGETNENRQGIIQGQMDTQLNDAGKAQAAATGQALEDVNFIAAYSSDSARAADTARAIIAHHPECELVLDSRLRERDMGSLSGTKAPARRPLPSSVEPSHSIGLRLNNFWDNTILPFVARLISKTDSTLDETVSDSHVIDLSSIPTPSTSPLQPAILLVSHGATISKLIHDVLLHEHGYTASCDVSKHGIYNTSISVLRLQVEQQHEQTESTVDAKPKAEVLPLSVSGELIMYASIAHIVKSKGKKIVKENADMLEQRSS